MADMPPIKGFSADVPHLLNGSSSIDYNGAEYVRKPTSPQNDLFEKFIKAESCENIFNTFQQLCDCLEICSADHRQIYSAFKVGIQSHKARQLWEHLDRRASHVDYLGGEACKDTRILVIGAGPCGLRYAIEAALLGAKVLVLEKRGQFSRNNVLHLWPYLITDLKNLGAKIFYPKFCIGGIDHINIHRLQKTLTKVALCLGVEIHTNTSFEELIEPPSPDKQTIENPGWRARISPEDSAVSQYQFDVLIGADGRRNSLPGFRRKEFRGKLAIAITFNFVNRHTTKEARVKEIGGLSFLYAQDYFRELLDKTGVDLENLVYFKNETHYFVMTAKKQSLLNKGVLLEDKSDAVQLLSKENVNQEALLSYARETAEFATSLPDLEYDINHYGKADIAMFDFTSLFSAVSSSRILERNGETLLMALVGDSLLQPFWPTGTGCARGFLGAFDAAWMTKSYASGTMSPLQVLAERESLYAKLPQTETYSLHKNFQSHSIDPATRYPVKFGRNVYSSAQVKHLYDSDSVINEDELTESSVVTDSEERSEYVTCDQPSVGETISENIEVSESTSKAVEETDQMMSIEQLISIYGPRVATKPRLSP